MMELENNLENPEVNKFLEIGGWGVCEWYATKNSGYLCEQQDFFKASGCSHNGTKDPNCLCDGSCLTCDDKQNNIYQLMCRECFDNNINVTEKHKDESKGWYGNSCTPCDDSCDTCGVKGYDWFICENKSELCLIVNKWIERGFCGENYNYHERWKSTLEMDVKISMIVLRVQIMQL